MFGRRKNPERSAQQFHRADSREEMFAQLFAESRADSEASFTVEVIDHAEPGPALDERAQRVIEAETVPRQVVVSPFFVDIAVRAVVGVVDWHPDFEHLRYRATPRSVDLFPEA
ncbi:hypothetical protein [Curtobacterium caseinilyticum]|uniref:Uncharacterized protein n=1 Tax=Curtobacterium caseinilyticum TaxID=3055137 RepID=A0ABT7TKH2_9MICO|nr:hypothetical protein [Curtobacterium caseinilyticum]MDM7890083.1 hypothetical protein [Curtobacterium caseinilyticum]